MEEHGEATSPSCFGNFEELAQVVTLKQLRYLDGPIVLVNTAGFYHLLAHPEHLYETALSTRCTARSTRRWTLRAALDYIEAYRPSTFPESGSRRSADGARRGTPRRHAPRGAST